MCAHIIGLLFDNEYIHLITFEELKDHIEKNKRF